MKINFGAEFDFSELDRWKQLRAGPLEDGKGIFGLALVAEGHPLGWDDTRIVLRPDRINDFKQVRGSILQGLPPAALGLGKRSAEWFIADTLFTALLARQGWKRYPMDQLDWGSDTDEGKAQNRRRYHALKAKSIAVTNWLVRRALEECPPDAVRAARRFPFHLRNNVYQVVSRSPRALQMVETFPLLLAEICVKETDDAREACRLVDRGVRLKTISDFMDVSMVWRNVKPAAIVDASQLGALFRDNDTYKDPIRSLVQDSLPKTTPAQRRWLPAVCDAEKSAGCPQCVTRRRVLVAPIPNGWPSTRWN